LGDARFVLRVQVRKRAVTMEHIDARSLVEDDLDRAVFEDVARLSSGEVHHILVQA